MCGIAGSFGVVKPDPSDWLPLLRHRGPDSEGTWESPSGLAGLAHTRLAILDLEVTGHQPMGNSSGENWLVFNGELYNYLELRSTLIGQGRVFKGSSDTEVLLTLLEGEDCCEVVNQLAGMYAFAFWDEGLKRGILSRDPFGIKPL